MGFRRFIGTGSMALAAVAQASAQVAPAFEPVTDAMLQNPDPKDWLRWRRTLDSRGLFAARPDQSRKYYRPAAAGVGAPARGPGTRRARRWSMMG